ncbi:uncharacterized protein LOC141588813 [Silene latifolia]|uniref:uncharacterized protein LOC141588813 n=1 Tax=Silene latifolia TaxID=37657 RepID=UPI003D77D6F0
MATTINRLEARYSNVLPSKTVLNPKNISAVSLRNRRQLVEAEKPKAKFKSAILHEEEEIVVEKGKSVTPEPVIEASVIVEPILEVDVPFPNVLKSTRRIENDKDIYETFRKCEVNIPLLDLLKSVPRYAKFLKELYTVKRQERLKGAQKVKVSEHFSAMFQRKLPPKCGDPGMFTIPCTLGDTRIERVVLDLGASINVIPYSLYKSMKLEMEHDKHAAPILLGRPFLKTASTKIDVSSGSLTMESDGQVVKFNIYDSMKYPLDVHSLNFIDIIEPCVQDVFNI